ncbi:hypothetical protein B0J14DRAFT_680918 [Halenospora varia]|nr:hypothetical protein B0J14DRAFT_680918 [Halenospora varia]
MALANATQVGACVKSCMSSCDIGRVYKKSTKTYLQENEPSQLERNQPLAPAGMVKAPRTPEGEGKGSVTRDRVAPEGVERGLVTNEEIAWKSAETVRRITEMEERRWKEKERPKAREKETRLKQQETERIQRLLQDKENEKHEAELVSLQKEAEGLQRLKEKEEDAAREKIAQADREEAKVQQNDLSQAQAERESCERKQKEREFHEAHAKLLQDQKEGNLLGKGREAGRIGKLNNEKRKEGAVAMLDAAMDTLSDIDEEVGERD